MSALDATLTNMTIASLLDQNPRPFLKWAGGKRRLLSQIIPRLGHIEGTYFEPFLGAGAVFLSVSGDVPRVAGDINAELVNAWQMVRDEPDHLIQRLQEMKPDKQTFLEVRALDRSVGWPEELSDLDKAVRTIFLNLTAYNGMFRVNKRGEFNVPFAGRIDPRVDVENLLRVSRVLNTRDRNGDLPVIEHSNYRETTQDASRGDVVYFDPPYAPISPTSAFVSYSKEGFGEVDQLELRDHSLALMTRGVRVLISNSDSELIRNLYKASDGFETIGLRVSRSVAASGKSRQPIQELLILGILQ